MRRFAWLAALVLAAACASPGGVAVAPSLPSRQAVEPFVEIKDPNFELVVVEAVPNAEDEGVSFTKIFVDGNEAGKTAVGPRSQEKRARLKLSPGNVPMRLEHWLLPPVGEWTRLDDARQPRERFVRVEDGAVTRLTLRYAADGAPVLQLTREAVSR